MQNFYKALILIVFVILNSATIQSQPGALDLSFGDAGKTTFDFLNNIDEARDVLIQPDGKIIVTGTCNINFINKIGLVRFNSDGSVDETFGNGGKVELQIGDNQINYGSCAILQPDGKILVGGTSFNLTRWVIALARFNPDGSLDNTFSNDGIQTHIFGANDYCSAMALQSDGKIIIAGSSGSPGIGQHFSVFRFNTDGAIDTDFNGGSMSAFVGVESGAFSVAVQSDGKIVLAGRTTDGVYSDVALVRFDASGILDQSFDSDGVRTLSLDDYEDYATKIIPLSGGKLLVGGVSNTEFALARFNANGSLDNTFSGDGIVETDMSNTFDELYDLAIDSEGKIVAAGHSLYSLYDMAVLRFNANGSLDNLFSLDGKTTTDFSGTYDYGFALALQSDGKIVVAGTTDAAATGSEIDFALVRYQGVCPIINTSQSISICTGESINVGTSVYSVSGNYSNVITLPSGCDSLVNTILTVLPNSSFNQNVTIGEGESFTVGNNTYTSSGTYTDNFFSANGCDSVVTTVLTVNTGIGNIPSPGEISIWPSPFINELTIDNLEFNDVLTLLDCTGKLIMHTQTTEQRFVLPSKALNPGVYLLMHHNKRGTSAYKIIKAMH
jgi:uncharacterized delta-60 repeat protein